MANKGKHSFIYKGFRFQSYWRPKTGKTKRYNRELKVVVLFTDKSRFTVISKRNIREVADELIHDFILSRQASIERKFQTV